MVSNVKTRREFIKKSLIVSLLGGIMPGLFGSVKKNKKYSYIYDNIWPHKFLDIEYLSFHSGHKHQILHFDITDKNNILWYDNNQNGLYKWRKIRNLRYYYVGHTTLIRINFELL